MAVEVEVGHDVTHPTRQSSHGRQLWPFGLLHLEGGGNALRWAAAHIGKGMRDEQAGAHKQVEQGRKHWPPR